MPTDSARRTESSRGALDHSETDRLDHETDGQTREPAGHELHGRQLSVSCRSAKRPHHIICTEITSAAS